MHQYVVIDQHGLDISVSFVKMRVDAHILGVLNVDPLAVLDAFFLDLRSNLVVVIGPVINDSEHAIYLQPLHNVQLIKDVNSTQVQISLIRWRFFLLLVDVDDVAALLVMIVVKHVKELL